MTGELLVVLAKKNFLQINNFFSQTVQWVPFCYIKDIISWYIIWRNGCSISVRCHGWVDATDWNSMDYINPSAWHLTDMPQPMRQLTYCPQCVAETAVTDHPVPDVISPWLEFGRFFCQDCHLSQVTFGRHGRATIAMPQCLPIAKDIQASGREMDTQKWIRFAPFKLKPANFAPLPYHVVHTVVTNASR